MKFMTTEVQPTPALRRSLAYHERQSTICVQDYLSISAYFWDSSRTLDAEDCILAEACEVA
jgi:hypothetical protein